MQPTPAAKEVVWGVPRVLVATRQVTHIEQTHRQALTNTRSQGGGMGGPTGPGSHSPGYPHRTNTRSQGGGM